MGGPTLLVTISAEEDRREMIDQAVPADIDHDYLEDIDDGRTDAIAETDGFLSFLPGEELRDEEFDHLRADHVFQIISAGINGFPFDRMPDGIVVQNNAGAHAEPIAEHILAMYLAMSKRLRIEHEKMRDGEFDQFGMNRQVDGSTCGIFGYGSIGQAAARRLQALGVEVMGINRSGEADRQASFVGTPDDLEYVLGEVDGLVLSAPATPETRGIIDREKLEWMAEDAMLINVGRGDLIVQEDLYQHLVDHPTFQAGIDAWWTEPLRDGEFSVEYPFLELPNVIGSPHNAARVSGMGAELFACAVERIAQTLTTGEVTNRVDPTLEY